MLDLSSGLRDDYELVCIDDLIRYRKFYSVAIRGWGSRKSWHSVAICSGNTPTAKPIPDTDYTENTITRAIGISKGDIPLAH
jgi:hypothetical protein